MQVLTDKTSAVLKFDAFVGTTNDTPIEGLVGQEAHPVLKLYGRPTIGPILIRV